MITNSFTRSLLAGLVLLARLGATQTGDDVIIKVTHVKGAVYMFEGSGGNIGVSAGPDGLLMIDDQYAQLAPKIEAALKDLDQGDLKFLVNTHYHGDHTGNNPHFGELAHIIAHTNVRKRLAEKPEEGWPVITFDDHVSIHFNGEEIKAIHYPNNHTDGDVALHFTKSGVVHLGDLFFSGRFPYIDLDGGGDVENLVATVGALLENLPEEVMLIPGHGPLSTKQDLRNYHNMLIETVMHIRKEMDDGMTLAQLQEAGLPAKWSGWAWSFISEDRWIKIVYTSLSR